MVLMENGIKQLGVIYLINEKMQQGVLLDCKSKAYVFDLGNCHCDLHVKDLVYFNSEEGNSSATYVERASLCNFDQDTYQEVKKHKCSCSIPVLDDMYFSTRPSIFFNRVVSELSPKGEPINIADLERFEKSVSETEILEDVIMDMDDRDEILEQYRLVFLQYPSIIAYFINQAIYNPKRQSTFIWYQGFYGRSFCSTKEEFPFYKIEAWYDPNMSGDYWGSKPEDFAPLLNLFEALKCLQDRTHWRSSIYDSELNGGNSFFGKRKKNTSESHVLSKTWWQILAHYSEEDIIKIWHEIPELQEVLSDEVALRHIDKLSIDYFYPSIAVRDAHIDYIFSQLKTINSIFLFGLYRNRYGIRQFGDDYGKSIIQRLDKHFDAALPSLLDRFCQITNVKQDVGFYVRTIEKASVLESVLDSYDKILCSEFSNKFPSLVKGFYESFNNLDETLKDYLIVQYSDVGKKYSEYFKQNEIRSLNINDLNIAFEMGAIDEDQYNRIFHATYDGFIFEWLFQDFRCGRFLTHEANKYIINLTLRQENFPNWAKHGYRGKEYTNIYYSPPGGPKYTVLELVAEVFNQVYAEKELVYCIIDALSFVPDYFFDIYFRYMIPQKYILYFDTLPDKERLLAIHYFRRTKGYEIPPESEWLFCDCKDDYERMEAFDEEIEPEDDCDNDFDEGRSYGKYSGSYAQRVEGYSDEDIDAIFGGEPDAYWNID